MDDLREFALEDELDELIESAADAVDDDVYSVSGDASPEPCGEAADGFDDPDDEPFDTEDGLSGGTGWESGVTYQTVPDLFSDGSKTYGSDGSTYKTFQNVFSEGSTTYGSDGSKYKTVKNVFSDGTTPYGSNGVTYKTVKKVFGDGSVTYGSDGSELETIPNLFGPGSTERKK